MYLSKSKYCNAIQCNKLLWLDTYKNEEKEEISNASVLDNGTEVGILAKELLGNHIDIEFNEDLNKMIEDTQKVMKENKNIVITEASFDYNHNFCSVDLLKKENNSYEIYEVKSSTEIKDIYLDDISYQYYVLSKLNLKVTSSYIIYINKDYIRKGELNLKELFTIENVTDKVLLKQKEVENKIEEINTYMVQKKEPSKEVGMQCVTPYPCPFFKYCTKHLPEKNIFKIHGMNNKQKFKLYQEGIYQYEDLLQIDINDKYKQQIEFELYNRKPYINKNKIKEFVNTITYPLYFLDFETYQQSIPEYDNIKPYMQIPFQYSLHYIKDNTLYHKEFLSEDSIDPRRLLAESLVKDIPLNVTTLAYNMMFEKMIIKNLANLYPDLAEHLMNIYSNMKDLMIPFRNRDYYVKEMQGSFSIKYVLPSLFPNDPSLNYHNLELIHNGSEAMSSFANLSNLSDEEKQIVRKNLLKYCELDTYAMVKIWEKLQEIVPSHDKIYRREKITK